MKTLTLLEVGNLDGLFAMIIGLILIVVFFFSVMVAAVVKLIYELSGDRKFSAGKFWLTVLISMLIGGLISGFVCGGM